MLFVLVLSVNAATATRTCWEAPDKLDLPSCTVYCLGGATDVLDGVCADNLKGVCKLQDTGVPAFFHQFGTCLEANCQNDEERRRGFIQTFQRQCGYSSDMSADQIAAFGDWKKFLATPGSPWVSTKADLSTVSIPAPPTSTSGTGASAYSSASSIEDSTFDSGYSTTLQISSSALPYKSTSAAPTAHLPSKPGLSPAAVAGVSIVSIVVLASIIVAVFFLSRRFRRSRYDRADAPPPYVPETNKDIYFQGKSELDAQHSEVGVRTPGGHAELDGASPFIYELDGAPGGHAELDGASRVNPMR